ncbi:unnamed protein product [Closterium sp. Naga37s-1]|nr:unnamed protein product [Closterium sp. Naga37s-1]
MSRTVTNRVARAVHVLLLAARSDSRSDGRGRALLVELRRLKKLPAGFLRSIAEELWRLQEFELAADVLESVPPATCPDNKRPDSSDSSDASDSEDCQESDDSEESEESEGSDFPARGGSSPESEMTHQQRTCGSQKWTGGALRLHARVAAGLVAANQVERGVQLIGQMPRVHTQQFIPSNQQFIPSNQLTAAERQAAPQQQTAAEQPAAVAEQRLSPTSISSHSSHPSHTITVPARPLSYASGCALIEAFGEVGVADGAVGILEEPQNSCRPLSYASGCALIEAFGEVGVVDGAVAMLLCMMACPVVAGWDEPTSGWDEPSLGCESRIPTRALKREAHAVLLLAAALARCSRPDDALALLRFVLQSGAATWRASWGRGQWQQVASMLHHMAADVSPSADVAYSNRSVAPEPAVQSPPPATTVNLAARLLGAAVVPMLPPAVVPQLLPAVVPRLAEVPRAAPQAAARAAARVAAQLAGSASSAEAEVGSFAGFRIVLNLPQTRSESPPDLPQQQQQQLPALSGEDSRALVRAFTALLRRYMAAVTSRNGASATDSVELQLDLHGLHSEAAAVVLLAWLVMRQCEGTVHETAGGVSSSGLEAAGSGIDSTGLDLLCGAARDVGNGGRRLEWNQGDEHLPNRSSLSPEKTGLRSAARTTAAVRGTAQESARGAASQSGTCAVNPLRPSAAGRGFATASAATPGTSAMAETCTRSVRASSAPIAELLHLPLLSQSWSLEEDRELERVLARHADSKLSPLQRYLLVAACLPSKTARDVAIRCRWRDKAREQHKRKLGSPQATSPRKKASRSTDTRGAAAADAAHNEAAQAAHNEAAQAAHNEAVNEEDRLLAQGLGESPPVKAEDGVGGSGEEGGGWGDGGVRGDGDAGVGASGAPAKGTALGTDNMSGGLSVGAGCDKKDAAAATGAADAANAADVTFLIPQLEPQQDGGQQGVQQQGVQQGVQPGMQAHKSKQKSKARGALHNRGVKAPFLSHPSLAAQGSFESPGSSVSPTSVLTAMASPPVAMRPSSPLLSSVVPWSVPVEQEARLAHSTVLIEKIKEALRLQKLHDSSHMLQQLKRNLVLSVERAAILVGLRKVHGKYTNLELHSAREFASMAAASRSSAEIRRRLGQRIVSPRVAALGAALWPRVSLRVRVSVWVFAWACACALLLSSARRAAAWECTNIPSQPHEFFNSPSVREHLRVLSHHADSRAAADALAGRTSRPSADAADTAGAADAGGNGGSGKRRAMREWHPHFLSPLPLHAVRLSPATRQFAAQSTNLEYLLTLDADRLLWSFRRTAGEEEPIGRPYGGWESPNSELRGHFVGHYLSASALAWASTGSTTLKARMEYMVGELGTCQQRIGSGYLSAFPEEFFDRVEAIQPVWAPYYTVHKIMAGLLDQYQLGGSRAALRMLTWMAEYFRGRVQRVIERHTVARHWLSLNEEFGGMNDLLYRLYAITRDPHHLELAHLFDKPCFLGPLALGADDLPRLHANTHIPIAIGAQMRYEATGDSLYRHLSHHFLALVNTSHSFTSGGTSAFEFWQEPHRSGHILAQEDQESCTTYNMLKVACNAFRWTRLVKSPGLLRASRQ